MTNQDPTQQITALDVRSLSKSFVSGTESLCVLNNVTFRVTSGELVAITGHSGSGKSTLLHLLGTLDSPSEGEIWYQNSQPHFMSDAKLSQFRNLKLGFVFQQNNLLPEFSAIENVMMPGLMANLTRKQVLDEAKKLLDLVGLSHRLSHFPGQLSGGEQQRVAVARALINRPLLVLADEPSGNLDSANADKIHQLLVKINEVHKTTILVVTHNDHFARSLPRKMTLHDGKLVSDVSN